MTDFFRQSPINPIEYVPIAEGLFSERTIRKFVAETCRNYESTSKSDLSLILKSSGQPRKSRKTLIIILFTEMAMFVEVFGFHVHY